MLVTMPQLGETVTEGTIVRWCKTVGDTVTEDEPLFEVSTDKVDTEVPSAVAGTIAEILAPEGATVAIGAGIAVVKTGDAGDPIPESAPVAPMSVRPVAPPPVTAAAPRTERVAMGARVTRDDVAARLAAREQALAASPVALPVVPGAAARPVPVAPTDRDDVQPFSSIRRRTADHMTRSLATSAHTLVVMQVDYSEVEAARAEMRDEFRTREGFGLTALPFVARAVVDAIREWPRLNASVGDSALLVHPDVHLGIAVDLDFEGLVVPVVRHANGLRLPALARAINERSAAARAKRLTADDLTGGTFTITNAGGYGTLVTAPVINQPQVAIVSTDGIAMGPVAVPVDGGAAHGLAVHPVGNLSLSFDHRAFDGAYASAFLARVVQLLETRRWAEELG